MIGLVLSDGCLEAADCVAVADCEGNTNPCIDCDNFGITFGRTQFLNEFGDEVVVTIVDGDKLVFENPPGRGDDWHDNLVLFHCPVLDIGDGIITRGGDGRWYFDIPPDGLIPGIALFRTILATWDAPPTQDIDNFGDLVWEFVSSYDGNTYIVTSFGCKNVAAYSDVPTDILVILTDTTLFEVDLGSPEVTTSPTYALWDGHLVQTSSTTWKNPVACSIEIGPVGGIFLNFDPILSPIVLNISDTGATGQLDFNGLVFDRNYLSWYGTYYFGTGQINGLTPHPNTSVPAFGVEVGPW